MLRRRDWRPLEAALRSLFPRDREADQRQAGVDAFRAGFCEGQKRSIDGALLRDAVSFCHPDRHPLERSEQANRTTAALLGLMRKLGTPVA